ncbi:MAG: hypothetical protein ACKOBG_12920 [Actinomycetota bacterium]
MCERAGSHPGPFVAFRGLRPLLTVLIVTAALLGSAAPAGADDTGPARGGSGPVTIGGGLAFTGAVVVGPLPGTSRRRLDPYTTAVFVQAWLPGGLFGPPPARSQPPPDAERYRIDVTGTWDGADAPPTTWSVLYATTPGRAWIACPRCRATSTPGEPAYWEAPARVTDALAGRAELVPVLALETTTTAPSGSAGGSDGGAAGIVVAGIVGVALIAGLVGAIRRSRRRRNA